MFNPDMLRLLGNSLGTVGWLLLLMMPVAVAVHLATIQSLRLLNAEAGNHIAGLQVYLGRRRAAIVALCGKLPFAVCASAALAVTAGFVFNEVFVYWFPNFAFAFMLLGTAAAVNLLSRAAAHAMQVVAVAAACLGLLILCAAGLSQQPGELSLHGFKFDFSYRYLAAAVVVLIGYDMGLCASGDDSDGSQRSGAMVAAVVGGALLLALWGLSAMWVITPDRLESSTVPYMTAARKALGQPGRYIMGAVAIAAVFSALNALMYSASVVTFQLADRYLQVGGDNRSLKIRAATVLLVAGASALLMAMGFAGGPRLETWIRSSLILWMIYYIFVNIGALRATYPDAILASRGGISAKTTLILFSSAALALAATGVFLVEPKPVQLLSFAVIVIAALATVVYTVDSFLNHSR